MGITFNDTGPCLYPRASLVAQIVKNLPAMQETLLGRSPREGIGYPLQYSWTSLGAQLVKNPPGKESPCNAGDLGSIPGLGRSLEKARATHSTILA